MATQPKVVGLTGYVLESVITPAQVGDLYGYVLESEEELGFVPSLQTSDFYGYVLEGVTVANYVASTYGYVLISDKELVIADATGELLQQRQI